MKEKTAQFVFWCWAIHFACVFTVYVVSFFLDITQELWRAYPDIEMVGLVQCIIGLLAVVVRSEFSVDIFNEEQRKFLGEGVFKKCLLMLCLLVLVTAIDEARVGYKGRFPENAVGNGVSVPLQIANHISRSAIVYHLFSTLILMGGFIGPRRWVDRPKM
ncbi:MAG: hypothetical protein WCS99_02720 [Limisphaerales bacterium]